MTDLAIIRTGLTAGAQQSHNGVIEQVIDRYLELLPEAVLRKLSVVWIGLRIDPKLYEQLERWAQDELRSVNGQIEFDVTYWKAYNLQITAYWVPPP